jgi:hypothetical protein
MMGEGLSSPLPTRTSSVLQNLHAAMGIPHRYPMIIQSPFLGSLHPQLHPEMNGIASAGVLPGKKIFIYLLKTFRSHAF